MRQRSSRYLTLIVIIPLCFSLLIIGTYLISSRSIHRQMNENLMDQARLQNGLIAQSLENALNSLVTKMMIIQEQHTHPHFSDNPIEFQTLLRRYVLSDPVITVASILNQEGEPMFSTRRGGTGVDASVLQMLKQVHSQQRLPVSLEYYPETGEFLLSGIIIEQGYQEIQILLFQIDTDRFFDGVADIQTLEMSGGMLTNQRGEVIAQWEKPETLSDVHDIAASREVMISHIPRILNEESPTAVTGGTKLIEDDQFLTAGTSLAAFPLFVTTVYDRDVYFTQWTRSIAQTLVLLFIFMLLNILVSLSVRKRLLRSDTQRIEVLNHLDQLVKERTSLLEQEIAAHKNTEAALRESHQFNQVVMDHLPVGIGVQTDSSSGPFRYMNEHFIAFSRTDKETLTSPGSFFDKVFPDETIPQLSNSNQGEGIKQRSWKELPIQRKGERTIYVDLLITGVPGQSYVITSLWDVTERVVLQQQLLQSQKIESIGRLAGGIAHDFNNMLSVILGYTEIAKDQVKEDHPLYASLQEIHSAAQRSASLTKQLLAFARKQTIDPKILSINEAVTGMLTMVQRLIGEDIDLRWIPTSEEGLVQIDPAQVDQLLVNLCINARQAITDTGQLTIETGLVTFDQQYCDIHLGYIPGDYVMLAVSDDGCGMDQETLRHVFEPFFTTRADGKGTGLGLATVYGIVRQNEGFINIYSEIGEGTSVKIYLPRRRVKSETGEKIDPPQVIPRAGGTVLLVDDDRMVGKMIHTMLTQLGYHVISVQAPDEALEIARNNSDIDVLVTDVVMPRMNGKVLYAQIRKLHPNLQCLFMSGYTANVIAHRNVLEPGLAFIQKPFSREALGKKIHEVLAEGANKQL